MNPVDAAFGLSPCAIAHGFRRSMSPRASSASKAYCLAIPSQQRASILKTARVAHSLSSIRRILWVRRLRAGSDFNTAKAAASASSSGEVQVQPAGVFSFQHAFSFAPVRSVLESVFPSHFSIGRYQRPALARPSLSLLNSSEAALEQQKLPLYGRLDGPAVAPVQLVQQCKTYREAVRVCWKYKRIARMTIRQLAAEGGFHPQHVGDWLNPDDKPKRKSLPGYHIEVFESLTGNSIVSQWVASRARLTVLEEVTAARAAA